MKPFIHHKVQAIDVLIAQHNQVRQLYIDRAFEFESNYRELLNECKIFLKSNGTNTQVGEVLNLEGMYETANKGIDPMEMKKVNTGRRSLKMMIANHGLNELLNLLKTSYNKEQSKIEEAEELLSNTLLGLVQSGALNDNKINDLDSILKIELFWNNLTALNESILLIDKKLKLKIIAEDIYLIIEKNLNRMK